MITSLGKRFLPARHSRASAAGNRKSGKPFQFESLEPRHALTAGAFLQGIAYIDSNSNNQLDPTDVRLPNATIQLFSANVLVGQAQTDAQGKYFFDDTHNVFDNDLEAGTYVMVEIPPPGFVNTSAQANTQINPAVVLTPMSIQVTIADPTMLFAHLDAMGTGVDGVTDSLGSGFAGQLLYHVDQSSTPTLPTPLHPQFQTLCVDLQNVVNLGDIYQVIPAPVSSLAHHGGEIAYLYNHYGQANLTNNQAAALQVAVWELLTDTVPDLSADTYQYSQDPAIVALANNFLAEAAGKDELAMVLDGTASGRQGIIATESYNFGNRTQNIIVIGDGKSPKSPQTVRVLDSDTGAVLSQFAPYENKFRGGIQVAIADVNGDGIDEIITAPGRGRPGLIRIFTRMGDAVAGFPKFLAYGSSYRGGVQLTVADVNGDGKPDIITVPAYGAAKVKVFLNQAPVAPGFSGTSSKTFVAFATAIAGGSVVAAADMGQLINGSFVNMLDGKAEIIVGTGAGTKATVKVFDVTGTPKAVRTIHPFTTVSSSFKGGVSLSVGRIDADVIPDIVIGAGANGGSRVEVWSWDTIDASLSLLGAIPAAFTGSSRNALVNVAAQDSDHDGIADTIFVVQGPGGLTGEIRRFVVLSTSPFVVQPGPHLAGFFGPLTIAAPH